MAEFIVTRASLGRISTPAESAAVRHACRGGTSLPTLPTPVPHSDSPHSRMHGSSESCHYAHAAAATRCEARQQERQLEGASASVGLHKGGVVHLTHCRGHCIAFRPSIPPLQVAPSFACSVASLSRSPGHQLSGCHCLRSEILADYLLGWGGPSTCVTGHAVLQYTPSPSPDREQEIGYSR